MNVVTVNGETVAKLSKLVKQAGEQQRQIVLELSQELGQHNQLLEKALAKEKKLDARVDRIEDKLRAKGLLDNMELEYSNNKFGIEPEEDEQKQFFI